MNKNMGELQLKNLELLTQTADAIDRCVEEIGVGNAVYAMEMLEMLSTTLRKGVSMVANAMLEQMEEERR